MVTDTWARAGEGISEGKSKSNAITQYAARFMGAPFCLRQGWCDRSLWGGVGCQMDRPRPCTADHVPDRSKRNVQSHAQLIEGVSSVIAGYINWGSNPEVPMKPERTV